MPVGQEKIGDWTEFQLAQFIQNHLSQHGAPGVPGLKADQLEAVRSLKVTDKLELSDPAKAYIQSLISIPSTATILGSGSRSTTLSISASTDAGANTIVTASNVDLDGSTSVRIRFFAPKFKQTAAAGSNILRFQVWRGATDLGRAAVVDDGGGHPAFFEFPDPTPAAGTYAYSVRASVDTAGATWDINAGIGGSTNLQNAWLLVLKDL